MEWGTCGVFKRDLKKLDMKRELSTPRRKYLMPGLWYCPVLVRSKTA
jgi:hypothetical protein